VLIRLVSCIFLGYSNLNNFARFLQRGTPEHCKMGYNQDINPRHNLMTTNPRSCMVHSCHGIFAELHNRALTSLAREKSVTKKQKERRKHKCLRCCVSPTLDRGLFLLLHSKGPERGGSGGFNRWNIGHMTIEIRDSTTSNFDCLRHHNLIVK
jgi:hypothetical protein